MALENLHISDIRLMSETVSKAGERLAEVVAQMEAEGIESLIDIEYGTVLTRRIPDVARFSSSLVSKCEQQIEGLKYGEQLKKNKRTGDGDS